MANSMSQSPNADRECPIIDSLTMHTGRSILELEELVQRITGEFTPCHNPYCQKPVNVHQANHCIVSGATYCDLCIEEHREECGPCALHLEQIREENRIRLARIPEAL